MKKVGASTARPAEQSAFPHRIFAKTQVLAVRTANGRPYVQTIKFACHCEER